MEFKYFDIIKRLINTVESKEKENMEATVKLMVDAILNKKSIFVFGASHAGIISEELYYRAGGLVVINPIFAKALMLDTSPITLTSEVERLVGYGSAVMNKTPVKDGDIVIVHSVSGRNPVSIEVAMEAKKINAKVICITNLKYSKSVTSRHPSGKNLYQIADIILDNHGDIGDACVEIDGIDQKVGPTSTVIAATVMNSIVAEVAQELINKGINKPPIFYSANLDGGDELNQKIFNEYKGAIHYKY